MAEAQTRLTPQQKIAKARQAYSDISAGKIEEGDYAPNAVWHSFAWGDVRDADAIRAALRKQRGAAEEFKLEPHTILADDEHVVALLNLKARAKGQTIEDKIVQVLHVNDQGQVLEIWSYGGNAELLRKLIGQ